MTFAQEHLMNPIDVQECISNYDIKAIFLIHTYGNPDTWSSLHFFVKIIQSY